ncbi:S-layer homology domain-containing protein [Cohnella fermenti]|uniref:DUF4430 domain-containing protein n=1 Tax=Cohnella fermenti TaxID=2565925 RepID=A0A4S4C1S8_9BACL|nr:S-layer homology domain-containing protein [Cohnella fermenti]THF79509.1 DUF4430 domain-containing protein [Cohnella fermenti]
MRTNKTRNSLLSAALLAVGLTSVAGGASAASQTANAPIGEVTMTVEKFTIGQGYYLEPTVVPFYAGDNGADLVLRALGEDNVKYQGATDTGFYLTGVKDSTLEANIPAYILSHMSEEPTARESDDEWLGEYDYSPEGGWMSVVNNVSPDVGPSDYKPHEGDVIRYQFTVSGYGADFTTSEWAEGYATFANKDKLTTLVAGLNSSSAQAAKLAQADIKSAYDNAYDVLKNLESTQASVDAAYDRLAGLLDWKLAFSDAGTISSWAADSLGKAVEKGYLQGSDGKLSPKATITRAEFAKLLVNVLGLELSTSASSSFSDVSPEKWYFVYVNTASEAGFISGYKGAFLPNDSITREQMASILVKALGVKDAAAAATIADAASVSAWAKADVELAIGTGLMQGQDNRFDPQGDVTREMATVVALRAYAYRAEHAAA